jgi:hypothetical protein
MFAATTILPQLLLIHRVCSFHLHFDRSSCSPPLHHDLVWNRSKRYEWSKVLRYVKWPRLSTSSVDTMATIMLVYYLKKISMVN